MSIPSLREAGVWLPAEARAEDMEHALQHEIVWAFRGGYGAVHLVPALLQAQAAGQPLLIGYSDITVLHACWRVRGWGPALYGTLSEGTSDARQAESLMAFLKGEAYECSSEIEPAGRVLQPGTAAAPLFPAYLVVLANLCGTPACARRRELASALAQRTAVGELSPHALAGLLIECPCVWAPSQAAFLDER